jgi:integrase
MILWESSDKNENTSVFNFKCVKTAFENACRDAAIETGRPFGITLHSLSHTAATRLVKGSDANSDGRQNPCSPKSSNDLSLSNSKRRNFTASRFNP